MIRHLCLAACLAMFTALVAGCAALGFLAAAAPPPTVNAAYTGLAGQKVGVMVWADRSIRIDFPAIQKDLAATVQKTIGASGTSEAQNITWVDARSIVKFQGDHPELDGAPVEEIAPQLGLTRLIYVEINDFQTRSHASMDLYRGMMNVSIRVVEVDAQGHATGTFNDDNVTTLFPPDAPDEGLLDSSDYVMYAGTVSRGAQQVANRFIPHEQEPEH